MSETCLFCKKSFANVYILNFHQKTTKYCLEIQSKQNTENCNSPVFSCSYCNKSFTLKSSLKTHYLNCKTKKDQEEKEEIKRIEEKQKEEIKRIEEKHREVIKRIEEKHREELEKNNIKYEVYIEKLEKDNTRLQKEIDDYKNRLFSRDEKLTEEILKRPTVINNNTNNTTNQQHIINYNNEFNRMFNELVPIHPEYLKQKIKEIKPSEIIYPHNVNNTVSNLIDYNFACNLVNILKNSVFFTDTARGKLVYKDENNNVIRNVSEKFITDVVKICKEEIIQLCKTCMEIVNIRKEEFVDEDLFKCKTGLHQLSECISFGKPHAIITEIANKLAKSCNCLPSINEFKKILKESTEELSKTIDEMKEQQNNN
jgi:hypothetical protein